MNNEDRIMNWIACAVCAGLAVVLTVSLNKINDKSTRVEKSTAAQQLC